MPLFGGISAAVALAGLGLSAAQMAKAKKDQREAKARLASQMAARPEYNGSKNVDEMVATARAMNGAPDPAVIAAQQQVQQQQANEMANAQRNASSGAQALAVGADASTRANSIIPALAGQQTAYNQQGISNLNQALSGKAQDERLTHEDQLSQYSDNANFQLGQIGAANQNKSQALALGIQSLGNAAGAYGQYRTMIAPKPLPVTTPTPSLQPVGSGITPTPAAPITLNPMQGGLPQVSPLTALYLKKYYNPYNYFPQQAL